MVEVEILVQVITAEYGTLSTGDVLRTSAEFAKHLVEDCAAAKYRLDPAAKTGKGMRVEPAQPAEPEQPALPAAKPGKKK